MCLQKDTIDRRHNDKRGATIAGNAALRVRQMALFYLI